MRRLVLLAPILLVLSARAAEPLMIDDTVDIKAFHAAAAAGKLKDLQSMLEDHPDFLSAPLPANAERDRLTPLHTAIAAGRTEIAKFLLDKGVSTGEIAYGATSLMRATYSGRDDIIELLLDRGADVNDNADGSDLAIVTPLRSAQIHGHPATAQILLEKGARVDLFSAAGLGWKTFVRDRLKKDPALVNTRDAWGNTPIWNAMSLGNAEMTKFLIDAGADFRIVHAEMKYSGLHLAASGNARELALLLLDAGLDINARDCNGHTPLGWAIVYKREALAALLKSRGGIE